MYTYISRIIRHRTIYKKVLLKTYTYIIHNIVSHTNPASYNRSHTTI